MKIVLYSLFLLVTIASCSGSYNIQGTSNLSNLDGQMLYLKVVKDQTMKNLDSCDVLHGQFSFAGNIDSVKMASLYVNEENMMPVVLESGEITIQITQTQQTVSGTPLNDKLFAFLKSYDQLQNQSYELVHKHDIAIMDGSNMDIVNRQLSEEYILINERLDKLVTTFITDNFDNVLGPGVFMMVTNGYPYPVFTPWIDDIMSRATKTFKNDPYVKAYVEEAKRIQNIQNGLEDPSMPPKNTTFTPPPPPENMERQVPDASSVADIPQRENTDPSTIR